MAYQNPHITMSKGKPRAGALVLGNTGVEMSKGKTKGRRFGAWEGCRLPT